MSEDWKDVNVVPDDDQRVLGFIPGNKVCPAKFSI